jgi:ABC-type antimicrobial peptide transport system permease subunit
MTRKEVVTIFTVEGAMYSIFAVVVGSIYGIPILGYLAYKGISMPSFADGFGISIPKTMYPYFSIEVVLLTILLVIIASTIVSFLPARKIAKMNPVLALKGKLQ